MLHDHLVKRGLRDRSEISRVIDFGRPIPPSPDASALLEGAFAESDIAWHPKQQISALDAASGTASLRDGGEMPFDLFLAVPVHRAPAVVLESGMAPDGWIPVNPLTLETSFDGVYGRRRGRRRDAERRRLRRGPGRCCRPAHRGGDQGDISDAEYGGRGVCYLEMGDGEITLVDVTFFGDKRVGQLVGPPPTTWPTRRSSARAGSSAGSGATGRRSERCRPRRGVRLS